MYQLILSYNIGTTLVVLELPRLKIRQRHVVFSVRAQFIIVIMKDFHSQWRLTKRSEFLRDDTMRRKYSPVLNSIKVIYLIKAVQIAIKIGVVEKSEKIFT